MTPAPRLKAALARRTGRSEEDLGLEERRRSTRVAEEEAAEDSSLLQDRASRRGRKEEPKLSDVRICSSAPWLGGWCVGGGGVGIPSLGDNNFFYATLRQSESPTNASIPELERQIDKLTKVRPGQHRNMLPSQTDGLLVPTIGLLVFIITVHLMMSSQRQQLFRKKLLQSSHSMRAISLGQDRFRRRYLALPHLGTILVEGPEELLCESRGR